MYFTIDQEVFMLKHFLCLFLFSTFALADSDSTNAQSSKAISHHSLPNQYSTYIGIAGGYTSGYGLSLRKWFQSKWGLQINLFPLYTQSKFPSNSSYSNPYPAPDSGYENYANFSFGILVLKELTQFKHGKIVYYAGGNVLINYDKYDYYDLHHRWIHSDTSEFYVDEVEHHSGRTLSDKFTVGTGAGTEFYIWRFAVHLMLGVCGGYDIHQNIYSILPSVEGGVQFRLF
jgi:hypothetical protein